MTDQRGRPTVVFDFDGTILDTRKIRYLVAGPGKKDYRAFYGRTLECPPNYEVVRAAQQHHAMGHAVIILSGRAHEWSAITLQAANRLQVPWSDAFFRANGDFRKAHVVKPELLAKARAAGYDPRWIWDDDPRVVDMWQMTEPDIEVTQVPGWNDPIEYPEGWLDAAQVN